MRTNRWRESVQLQLRIQHSRGISCWMNSLALTSYSITYFNYLLFSFNTTIYKNFPRNNVYYSNGFHRTHVLCKFMHKLDLLGFSRMCLCVCDGSTLYSVWSLVYSSHFSCQSRSFPLQFFSFYFVISRFMCCETIASTHLHIFLTYLPTYFFDSAIQPFKYNTYGCSTSRIHVKPLTT